MRFNLTLLLITFTLLVSSVFGQGKLDKLKLERYNLQYVGDYKKALDVSNEITKLIDKKYLPKPFKFDKAMEIATQSELMRLLGKGKGEINSKALLANTLSEGAFGKESWETVQIKLTTLNTLIKYGELIDIQPEINALKDIATNNDWGPDKTNEIKACQINYFFATGYYLEALELHNKIIKQQEGKIVTHKDVIHKKKGTIKSKKLKKPFYAKLQREYSELLQLKGQILIDRGDYNSALEYFKTTEEWIIENTGKKDVGFLINKYYLGAVNEELQLTNKAINLYEYLENRKATVSNSLKLEPTSEAYRRTSIALARHYTTEAPGSNVGELLFMKTKRRLAQYDKGGQREPLDRLIKALSYYYQQNYKKAIAEYQYIKQDYFDQSIGSPLEIDFLEIGLMIYSKLDRKKNINLTLKELEAAYNTHYPIDCPKRYLFDAKQGIFKGKFSNDFDMSLTLLEGILSSSLADQLHIQSKHYLAIIDNIAAAQVYTEQFDNAVVTLKKGITSSKEYSKVSPPHFIEAVYNMKVASLYFDIGYIDDFLDYYNEADSILDQLKEINKKENSHRADYLILDAEYQILLGNLKQAENSLDKASRISNKEHKKFKSNKDNYGDIEEFITLDIKKGNYISAESKINEILNSKERNFGPNSRKLIKPLSKLSELYLVKGDLANSSKTINRNLDIARSNYGKKSLTYGEILSYRGQLLNDLGDYQGAISEFDNVLKIYLKKFPEEHILTAKILSLKGLAMMHSGEYKPNETHQILIKASKIIESALRTRKSPAFAESIQNLALFSINNGHLDQAEKMLSLATSIWEDLPGIDKVNINTAAILILEGDIFKSRKEYDLAKEKYNKGKKYYEAIFNNKHPKYIYALSKLSKIYFIQDDEKNVRLSIDEIAEHHIEFIHDYFPSLSERDKTKYWKIISEDFEFYNNIAFKYKDEKYIKSAYNFALITKALLLNSSIKIRKTILNSNDTTLVANFNLYTEKKEQLASILSKSSELLRKKGIDKDDLNKEINDLEVTLSEESEYFNQTKKKKKMVHWNDIQKRLEENEYAIEILRYRKFEKEFTDKIQYSALIVSEKTKKAPSTVHFSSGTELENKHISYYRNSTRFKSHNTESYTYFWKSIHEVVGDNSTIYLSADGVFNQINLEALAINKTEYVIDKNNIVLVNNTKSVIDLKNQETIPRNNDYYACLVGNPNFYKANDDNKAHTYVDYHQSIKQLLGTEKEINVISPFLKKNNWKTKEFIFNDASESDIKKITNPRVLHFASHGFFLDLKKTSKLSESSLDNKRALENPLLRSGILLKYAGDIIENLDPHDYNTEDGILTAYEAMNMNLDQTEIVILSACETGLGKVHNGEGVYGLQRAFLVAGAKSIIMSLFKVDDAITKDLMVSFYKHWSKTNDKREAFQLAKNEIRKAHPHPIYWGAFVMVGI